jgi:hypothetical protein
MENCPTYAACKTLDSSTPKSTTAASYPSVGLSEEIKEKGMPTTPTAPQVRFPIDADDDRRAERGGARLSGIGHRRVEAIRRQAIRREARDDLPHLLRPSSTFCGGPGPAAERGTGE